MPHTIVILSKRFPVVKSVLLYVSAKDLHCIHLKGTGTYVIQIYDTSVTRVEDINLTNPSSPSIPSSQSNSSIPSSPPSPTSPPSPPSPRSPSTPNSPSNYSSPPSPSTKCNVEPYEGYTCQTLFAVDCTPFDSSEQRLTFRYFFVTSDRKGL